MYVYVSEGVRLCVFVWIRGLPELGIASEIQAPRGACFSKKRNLQNISCKPKAQNKSLFARRDSPGGTRPEGFARRDSPGGIRPEGFARRDSPGGTRPEGFAQQMLPCSESTPNRCYHAQNQRPTDFTMYYMIRPETAT